MITGTSSLIALVSIVAVFGTPIAIVAIIAWAARGSGGKSPARDADEVRLMQELNQGLHKMESRIEALETLLLEGERKGDRS
jgi:hypothetical protein